MCKSRCVAAIALWMVLLFFLSAGQSSAGSDIRRSWIDTLSKLGMVPVYPPREDVQVGDIYLFPNNPGGGNLVKTLLQGNFSKALPSRWCTMDLPSANEYANRYEWPETPMDYRNYLSNAEDYLFYESDLLSAQDFAAALKGTDEKSKYIHDRLSADTQALVEAVGKPGQSESEALRPAIIRDLNRLLQSPLWSETHFADVPENLKTLAKTPVQGKELIRLNRLLLESSYPTLLAGWTPRCNWTAKQPTNDQGVFIPPTKQTRLKIVGFPDFITASANSGSLEAIIPTEALSIGLKDAKLSKTRSVSVKVPAAESYSVSGQTVLSKLFWASPDKVTDAVIADGNQSEIMGSLSRMLAVCGMKDKEKPHSIYVQVLTEVYYARAMDISIAGEFATQATARVSTLNEDLATAGTQKLPGGSISFVGASDTSIGMRRTWERPVAIGYRGWSFKLTRDKDGTLSVSEMEQTSIPGLLTGLAGTMSNN